MFIQAYTKLYQLQVVRQDGKLSPEKDTENSNRESTSGLAITTGPAGSMVVLQHKQCHGTCLMLVQIPED